MTTNNRDTSAKTRLADQVKDVLATRLEGEELINVRTFVDIFWRQLPLDDWQGKEVSDIAGCCYSLWFALHLAHSERLVKVFNPTLEEHGWLCNGTAIVVRQRDTPFIVDSLRLALNRNALPIHTIKSTLLNVDRDEQGRLIHFGDIDSSIPQAPDEPVRQEALIYIEIGLIAEQGEISALQSELKQVLADVDLVVDDYRAMLEKTAGLLANLEHAPNAAVTHESQAFIEWLRDSHFTFLGYREYELVHNQSDEKVLKELPSSRLGIFRKLGEERTVTEETIPPGARAFYQNEHAIAFSKSANRSTVHRPVYPDYIVVKCFDDNGEVVGEVRLLGLFTYAVYSMSPSSIPILRQKVTGVIARSGLSPVSHDGKNLLRVLESFPRDELFQSDGDTLYNTAMGVASISERNVVRLFMRDDPFGKFVYCIVYVPRDKYNTGVRHKIERLIGSAIHSEELDSTTYFSESTLARAYMVFRVADGAVVDYDYKALEAGVIDITRGWEDRFESALIEAFGEASGIQYYRRYAGAFSISYQENFDARSAVSDIKMLESLSSESDIAMHFFHPLGAPDSSMRFKVMQLHNSLELSDVIPVLEHLGLRVLGEHPHRVQRSDHQMVWLHDFSLTFGLPINLDANAVSKLFEQAFAAVWHGQAESDAFNRLVLGARLHWREVVLLRAYAGYMKQTAFTFSHDYIADTLTNQLEITRNLVALFKTYFDPRVNDGQDRVKRRIERLKDKIVHGLEGVENLNEDKILRRYFDFINATLRTNFYQKDETGGEKDYVSFKFSPRDIADIPEPKPMFEIYVYSPRVEGVHLRASRVARGGLRWSDRLQDYRTEVLGLVKAQQVKNAVIVPSGAKGGFVLKRVAPGATRDEFQAEGVACYKIFIRGLLDLTDNYVHGELVQPKNVICRDEADPYLVVAADKGTATFSDIANELSEEYGHWLGDAFASGGSQGYDHKKMGITARGAWVSVQRHFREMGRDIQSEPFTVVGIGDMAGDVFGNGMLLSPCIRLVAAFNHQHIFIDPTPDQETSFAERKRLFEMPRSAWSDYNPERVSPGGGVFPRSAKSIAITEEMQQALDIQEDKLAPTELISAILKAPVDLVWNGGIGTYVKAETESHNDVGDKANDAVRIDGGELRCKVIGEGGNLGMTQLGRVEFALSGGACNTDFIDNAGGVDCSDHEVNIKILLDEMIAAGDLTQKQRNQLLSDMTEQVADLVLLNNYRQSFALSIAQYQAVSRIGEYRRFIQYLEGMGRLNRSLEYLPDEEQISERVVKSQPLTRPELAVLLSYAKVMLKEEFIEQAIADEPYLQKNVESAFPRLLRQRFPDQIYQHRLMNEIVATQTANDFINSLGVTSAHRLLNSTGATLRNIAIAYVTARDVFQLEAFQTYLQTLDNQVPARFQAEIMTNIVRRVRRGTRWFLRNRRAGINPAQEVAFFADKIRSINAVMEEALVGRTKENWQARCVRFKEYDLGEDQILQLAMPDNLFSGLSIIEVARVTECDPILAANIFFALYEKLNLEWFATQLSEVKVESYWQAMAREAFLDDLEAQLRKLARVLVAAYPHDEVLQNIDQWLESKAVYIDRWLAMVHEVQNAQSTDFAMFSVALRELIDLAQTCSLEPKAS